jgi:hypothetical protein
MRRLANENPTAQIALIGILVLVCGFLLYSRVLSSGESGSESTSPATTTPGATEAAAPVPGASAEAVAPETPAPAGTVAPETAPEGEVPQDAFAPSRGLPPSVVDAYEDGKVVVLLVVKQRGLDDQPVEAAVRVLEGDSRLAVFVTGAKNIARYSRITQGVNVSRVPALVVVQPRSRGVDVPTASVSYGFRGADSVVQAVRDALYKGGKVPYHPE